jgi:Raf kinase inhibitor-like YbhB/YbcL family protein
MRYLLLLLINLLITASSYADTAPVFTLNTTAFVNHGTIPPLYTCDGNNLSPEVDWTNLPDKTQTLALVFSDPSALGGTFYHWIIFNIPTNITTLPEGMTMMPGNISLGKNSDGTTNYKGPCPPQGSKHTYFLTLYALDAQLNIVTMSDIRAILNAMQNHILGKAEISATYGR